jgi:BirA family biotin operon repressor/biotin-[acetyl-CoA-carboxylase] ligase
VVLNPRERDVLAALDRGSVDPSGLGDRLELPAPAVMAHVDTLREHGFEIERGPAGFTLETVPDYGYGVQASLDAPFVIDYEPMLASTNDRARERAEAGETDVAVLADEQTGGRGRFDRTWASPAGGLYCSVLIRPKLSPDRLGVITLAAAVAAAEAADAADVHAACKWPNDLQGPDGCKLGGILSESATRAGAVEWVVIGLGLNGNAAPEALPPEATSLHAIHGERVDRRSVTQAYLETFDRWRRNPEGVVDAWRDRAATLGQEVWVRTGEEEVIGEAQDIDPRGRLVIETEEGLERVSAGECGHLRPV